MKDKRWIEFEYHGSQFGKDEYLCAICEEYIENENIELHRLNHLLFNLIESIDNMNKKMDELIFIERSRK